MLESKEPVIDNSPDAENNALLAAPNPVLEPEDNTSLTQTDLKTFESLFLCAPKVAAEEKEGSEGLPASNENLSKSLTFAELQRLAVLVEMYQGDNKNSQSQLARSLKETHYSFQAWDFLDLNSEEISDDSSNLKKGGECFQREKAIKAITVFHFWRLAIEQVWSAQAQHLLVNPGSDINTLYPSNEQVNFIATCVAAGLYLVRLCLAWSLSMKDYENMSSDKSNSFGNCLTFFFLKGPYSHMIINDVVWCLFLVTCAVGSYILDWGSIASPALIAFGYLVDVVNFGVKAKHALEPYHDVLKDVNKRIDKICENIEDVEPSVLTLSNLGEKVEDKKRKKQLFQLLKQKHSIGNTLKKMKAENLYSNRLRVALMLGKIILATAVFASPHVALLLALIGVLIVVSARVGRVKEMVKHSVQESELKKKVNAYRLNPNDDKQKEIDVLSSIRYLTAVQHVCFELGFTGVSMALSTALATSTTAFLVSNPVGLGLLIVGASLLMLALVIWCAKGLYIHCVGSKAQNNNGDQVQNGSDAPSIEGFLGAGQDDGEQVDAARAGGRAAHSSLSGASAG